MMLRKIFAVIGGIVVANLIIFLVEAVDHMIYPMPDGVTYEKVEAFRKYVQELPVEAKVIVIFGYAFAAFSAGFVSTRIAKDRKPYCAIFCGAVLLSVIILNFTMLPTPTWMWICGLAAPFLVFPGYKMALTKSTV
ncbi:hypothetical protein [Chryseobacterium sp. Leaf394]|uniref:hypothetical protein n=1 Tax=Chryseobacterium sp. Leaf394 TaxID=1736361 RepID=UPI0006F840EE|nr:hypothetical protein [Chryseobacterium sp. Leaf394]KQS92120.1 hypothetical protein ASG21_06630 [Chryseobacterium sp. Leaf394]